MVGRAVVRAALRGSVMSEQAAPASHMNLRDPALVVLAEIAGFFRIAVDPAQLAHQLALTGRKATSEDLVRAARHVGLKARILRNPEDKRFKTVPMPAIISLAQGGFG